MFALPRGISRLGLLTENQRRMHFEFTRVAVHGDAAALREALELWKVLPKGRVRE